MSVPLSGFVGIAIVAAAATFGDFIWYTVGVRHTMTAGILHGALLLTTVGGVLGLASGRVMKGLPIGTLAGIGGALSYYAARRADGFAHLRHGDSSGLGDHVAAARGAQGALAQGAQSAGLGGSGGTGRVRRGGRWHRLRARQERAVGASARGGPQLCAAVRSVGVRLGARATGAHRASGSESCGSGIGSIDGGRPGRVREPGCRGRERGGHWGADLLARIDRGETPHVLDVRSEMEFGAGHVPGASTSRSTSYPADA